ALARRARELDRPVAALLHVRAVDGDGGELEAVALKAPRDGRRIRMQRVERGHDPSRALPDPAAKPDPSLRRGPRAAHDGGPVDHARDGRAEERHRRTAPEVD